MYDLASSLHPMESHSILFLIHWESATGFLFFEYAKLIPTAGPLQLWSPFAWIAVPLAFHGWLALSSSPVEMLHPQRGHPQPSVMKLASILLLSITCSCVVFSYCYCWIKSSTEWAKQEGMESLDMKRGQILGHSQRETTARFGFAKQSHSPAQHPVHGQCYPSLFSACENLKAPC